MACLDNETATAYLRGDLEPDEADRWASHLAGCDACRELVQQVSALMDGVRQDLMLAYTQPVSVDWRRFDQLIQPSSSRGWQLPGLAAVRLRYVGSLVAVASLILIAIWWHETPISAAEALERAAVTEQAIASNANQIVHRTLAVEERATRGAAPSRQRVEIWQNAALKTKVRRLYDDGGRLVAGEWTRGDGSRALYQPSLAPVIESAGTPVPLDASHAWRFEPSVQTFTQSASTERLTLERAEGDAYVIALDDPIPSAPSVASATLTLSGEDFRPVSQTFVFERDGDTREVALIERQWEALAPDRVEPARFVPDPELLVLARPAEAATSLAKPSPIPRVAAPTVETDHLGATAMRAWYRLHGLGLALGRDAVVEETDGAVKVNVTVSSELRRMAVAQRLEGTGAQVRLDIRVVPEATTTTPVSAADWTGNRTYQRIHDQVLSTIGGAPSAADRRATADIVARETARWIVEEAQHIRARVEALSRFSSAWPLDRLRTIDLDTLAEWQTIVRDHAVEAGERAGSLRQRSGIAFGSAAPARSISRVDPLTGPPDVERLVLRLSTLAERQADVLTRSLPSSATDAGPPELDLDELHEVLIEIEHIAARFAGPWSLGR